MNLVPKEIKEADAAELAIEIADKNPAVRLMDLETPEYGNDPNEIIANRFLYRGGICVLSAPTGVGKSSFIMQWAMHLATGADLFGMQIGGYYSGKPLRVLVIQAENDESDLAETRDGVIKACGVDMAVRASETLSFVTMPDACAEEFAVRLNAHCTVHEPDVVFIDPVFSFLGGDNSAQKDVTHWIRNLVNPILMKHKVSAVLTHHVNKPKKDDVDTGAYNMSGSAEWANAARCCLALIKAGEGLYWLVATKRGQRLGWKDEAGDRTDRRLIAYHGGEDEHGRPIIAWREADESELPVVEGRARCTIADVESCLPEGVGGKSQSELVEAIKSKTGVGRNKALQAIKEAEGYAIEGMQVGRKTVYTRVRR